MYLYYFERILRRAAGDPTLTLPYWDYSQATNRQLPLPFRQPATAANPLYIRDRDPDINAGQPLQDNEVEARQALSRLPFFVQPDRTGQNGLESFGGAAIALPAHLGTFVGQLEDQPHNVIHITLGGFMSDPNCAARDPIFYLHHANIDRLWEVWLRQGGGRVNPTTNDVWLTTPFTFFDENGARVTITGQQILTTATLGYRYDDVGSPPPAPQAVAAPPAARDEAREVSQALATIERLAVLSDTGLQAVDFGPQGGALQVRLSEDGGALLSAAATGESPPRLSLVLADVQLVSPGAYFAVYLNLPPGTAPDAMSIYYVGNLALFGAAQHAQHAAHGMPGREFMFDVTDTVRALQAQGEWRDEFTLTFFRNNRRAAAPAPTEPPGFLRIGRVLLMQD
jgi:tyrosinase